MNKFILFLLVYFLLFPVNTAMAEEMNCHFKKRKKINETEAILGLVKNVLPLRGLWRKVDKIKEKTEKYRKFSGEINLTDYKEKATNPKKKRKKKKNKKERKKRIRKDQYLAILLK